jgi:hypothetical protein
LLRELDPVSVSDRAFAVACPVDFVSNPEESCATLALEADGEASGTPESDWAFNGCPEFVSGCAFWDVTWGEFEATAAFGGG